MISKWQLEKNAYWILKEKQLRETVTGETFEGESQETCTGRGAVWGTGGLITKYNVYNKYSLYLNS